MTAAATTPRAESFYSLLIIKTAPPPHEDRTRTRNRILLRAVMSGLGASSSTGRLLQTLRIGGQGSRLGRNCHHHNSLLQVVAVASEEPQGGGGGGGGGGPSKRQRAPRGVDTRIHWDSPDQGWIGGGGTTGSQQDRHKISPEEEQKNLLGEKFADLLNDFSDSHYQFLGVSADADLEEIKAAYRRLSKEYHPDTTSLPLKIASDKFMKLREVYDILSNGETRRFYDWTLAQEAASRQAKKMRMRLEDPYEQDLENYKPVPDMVDRLGGRNMALSDQAMTALTIDVFIVLFVICCIIYVVFFKEPYY